LGKVLLLCEEAGCCKISGILQKLEYERSEPENFSKRFQGEGTAKQDQLSLEEKQIKLVK